MFSQSQACRYREPIGPDHGRTSLCRHSRVRVSGGIVTPEICHDCQYATARAASPPPPVLPLKSQWRWSVGVTTAPRETPTLARCLSSLDRAGWPHPHIFAEPDCHVTPGYEVTRRGARMGAWPNWYLALAELVLRDPLADCYFLAQDDVILCRNSRLFLESEQWPAGKVGLVSLYCPSIYHAERSTADYGPHEVDEGFGLVGALTFLFPPESARALLQDTNVVEHRLKGRRKGLCNIDAVVGRWVRETGRKAYFYSPSLADHIGETSSIWLNQQPRRGRTCHSFLGEQFNAMELLS